MKSESQRDVSFDPRSWVGPEAGGTGAPSPPRPAPRPAPAPNGEKARWAFAAAASIVILLVGLGFAWSQRTAARVAAPAVTSAASG